MKKNELIAYAMDLCSYIVSFVKVDIRSIVLFGSVARGTFDEESDIDLFIDLPMKKTKTMEKKIKNIIHSFMRSKRIEKWKLIGIKNDFSVIVGNLEDKSWTDLKRSIISDGVFLFGKYKAVPQKTKQYMIFSFKDIKPEKKRIRVFRNLYGYKIDRKKYSGLIETLDGIKIGKGAVMVPAENSQIIQKLFRKEKLTPNIFEVWMD